LLISVGALSLRCDANWAGSIALTSWTDSAFQSLANTVHFTAKPWSNRSAHRLIPPLRLINCTSDSDGVFCTRGVSECAEPFGPSAFINFFPISLRAIEFARDQLAVRERDAIYSYLTVISG
jgi:hypothetical protein